MILWFQGATDALSMCACLRMVTRCAKVRRSARQVTCAPAPSCMRRGVAALTQRTVQLQRLGLAPLVRACSSAAGPGERVVRSLADSSGAAVTELDLSGRGGAHEDLVCVNIMCEHVGGVCICRLSRVLERPSMQNLHTLRLAGNGCAARWRAPSPAVRARVSRAVGARQADGAAAKRVEAAQASRARRARQQPRGASRRGVTAAAAGDAGRARQSYARRRERHRQQGMTHRRLRVDSAHGAPVVYSSCCARVVSRTCLRRCPPFCQA